MVTIKMSLSEDSAVAQEAFLRVATVMLAIESDEAPTAKVADLLEALYPETRGTARDNRDRYGHFGANSKGRRAAGLAKMALKLLAEAGVVSRRTDDEGKAVWGVPSSSQLAVWLACQYKLREGVSPT